MQDKARAANKDFIKGATGDWEVVIGMEVHAQVTSNAKLFSGASTEFGGEPNSHVSLVDAAMPGMLPVINEECVAQAVRTGLGLKAQINLRQRLRPQELLLPGPAAGLPDQPVQEPDRRRGRGRWSTVDGETITVGIERLHLEQDAGKSIHDQHPDMSLRRPQPLGRGADGDRLEARPALGRGGAGLRHQAAHHPALSRHLRRRHGEGQPARRRQRLGAPARRRRSARAARSRTSTRSASSARPSTTRRAARSASSRTAARSTRRRGSSTPARARRARCARKEEAHDYRYFPDPDLLPLEFDAGAMSTSSAKDLPELPDARRRPLHGGLRPLGLRRRRAGRRARDAPTIFEAVAKGRDGKARRQLGHQRAVRPPEQGRQGHRRSRPVSAAQLGAHRRPDRRRTSSPARSPRTCSRSSGPKAATRAEIVEKRGHEAGHRHRRHRGGGRRDHRRQPRQGRAGRRPSRPLLGWFVGQVMKATGGKANPQAVNEMLKRKLGI